MDGVAWNATRTWFASLFLLTCSITALRSDCRSSGLLHFQTLDCEMASHSQSTDSAMGWYRKWVSRWTLWFLFFSCCQHSHISDHFIFAFPKSPKFSLSLFLGITQLLDSYLLRCTLLWWFTGRPFVGYIAWRFSLSLLSGSFSQFLPTPLLPSSAKQHHNDLFADAYLLVHSMASLLLNTKT